MKILLAPDSFKGSLSSLEVIKILKRSARRVFPSVDFLEVPIADGGEGTVDALVIAGGGEYREKIVKDPLGRPVKARYGIIRQRTAVIEMAQASGLPLLPAEERNPLITTSYGTGELIRAALDEGLRDIIIGIGGSATNDGGIGAVQALGIKFVDAQGKELGFGGRELARIESISIEGLDPRIKESRITVICDVTNPLTGGKGATAVYGPQKGATEEMLKELEAGMKHYARLLRETTGLDMDRIPGSGAAGGLGAALVGFFHAVLKPGAETILDLVGFDELLEGVDLVVTGEGKMDGQSLYGKTPLGVAERCRRRGIPVIAVAGMIGEDASRLYGHGIGSMMSTYKENLPLEEAMERAAELLEDAGDRMFRLIRIGMGIQCKQTS
ncbi:MAG: glycerate kinase [Clostridia bacterium]|jgi:glycerate kinase